MSEEERRGEESRGEEEREERRKAGMGDRMLALH